MKPGQQVVIGAGCGYWDLTKYPWDGCFCRAPKGCGIDVEVIEVVGRFSDGTPRQIRVKAADGRILGAGIETIETLGGPDQSDAGLLVGGMYKD